MDGASLVNFEPLLRLLMAGALVAAGPLVWWWARTRGVGWSGRLTVLSALTLFLCFDLVVFGAFTRLTDSGLGCPDWPGCYGHASPLGAHADIGAAQTAQPTGPVTHGKAWIEMVHRYLATGVGALIAALAVGRWIAWTHARRASRPHSPSAAWWASVTLVWVCVQGAFGAFTVTLKLYPAIVTAHLIGGLVLLSLLAVQAWPPARQAVALTPRLRQAIAVAAVIAAAQIVLGGWVSTNYAVLACTEFPTCQGSWWPAVNFSEGFSVLRPLGVGSDGGWLPFEALTAIHLAHRMGAVAVSASLAWLVWHLWRHLSLRRFAVGLAAVWLWQAATGISSVVLGWPLLAAVGHTAGAAVLTLLLTRLAVIAFASRGATAMPRENIAVVSTAARQAMGERLQRSS